MSTRCRLSTAMFSLCVIRTSSPFFHHCEPIKPSLIVIFSRSRLCYSKADDLYRGSMQSEDHRRTALQYPLFIGPYAAANNTALLARRPSQGTKSYCLVNRGTLGVNNLPRVVARKMPWSESNPRPLDHESNALPLHHRVTYIVASVCRLSVRNVLWLNCAF